MERQVSFEDQEPRKLGEHAVKERRDWLTGDAVRILELLCFEGRLVSSKRPTHSEKKKER